MNRKKEEILSNELAAKAAAREGRIRNNMTLSHEQCTENEVAAYNQSPLKRTNSYYKNFVKEVINSHFYLDSERKHYHAVIDSCMSAAAEYGSNIESSIRARGEHELANALFSY